MKRFLKSAVGFLFVFAVTEAVALPADTTDLELLKARAVTAFAKTINSNKAFIKDHQTDSLNFVVELGNEEMPPADSAIYLRQVPGTSIPFMGTSKHTELNNYLKQVFQQEGIACYILFISYFDYKIAFRLSDYSTVTNIITYSSKYETIKKEGKVNPEIEKLKLVHKTISDAVYQSITKDHPFVFMDVGKYCRPAYIGKDCDYIGMYYFSGIPADLKPHLSALLIRKLNGSFPNETSDNEIAEANTYSLAAAVIQSKLKKQILTTDDKDDLCDILSESNYPFDHQTFVSTAYGSLTLSERIHAIKIFLKGYVGGSFIGCNAEQKIVSIVKNTPTDQIDSLLLRLETDSLLSEMVSAIDDFGPGGNNYESLLKTFSELVLKSPTFDQRIQELHNPSTGAFRSFIWDKSYAFSLSHTPVGTNKYDVDILDNQQIEIYRSYVKEWRLTGYQAKSEIPLYEEVWVKDEQPTLLHPFDLIMFIDHSKLGLIDGGNVGGELGMALMPAVFMKYADDKKFNANTIKGLVIAVDIATLVSGPGAIAKAFQIGNRIRQALVIADLVNSGLNLIVNLSDLGDSRFAEVVEWYNNVMLAIGVTKLSVAGVARLPDVANAIADWTTKLGKATVKSFLIACTSLRLQLKAANFDVVAYCRNNKNAESIFAMEDQLRKEWVKNFPTESLPIPTNFFANVSAELQNVVRARIPNKAEELLEVLNTNSALKQAMEVENSLMDAWARITDLTQYSDDVPFLRSMNIVEAERRLQDHIFLGHRQGGSISGVHYHAALTTKTSGFAAGDIRIKPGTKTPPDAFGVYSGEVEYFDGTAWRPKNGGGFSTFYPENMTKEMIVEELAFAHSRNLTWVPPTGTTGSNTFEGLSSRGFRIRFFIGDRLMSAPTSVPIERFVSAFPIQ